MNKRASLLFPDFHSTHEGYAIILGELDELLDEIKKEWQIKKHANGGCAGGGNGHKVYT